MAIQVRHAYKQFKCNSNTVSVLVNFNMKVNQGNM
jgi:hypothetical protein